MSTTITTAARRIATCLNSGSYNRGKNGLQWDWVGFDAEGRVVAGYTETVLPGGVSRYWDAWTKVASDWSETYAAPADAFRYADYWFRAGRERVGHIAAQVTINETDRAREQGETLDPERFYDAANVA